MREQGLITAHEHDLYNFLVHKCNRLGWKNPFCQPTEVVCAILKMNRNAFGDRRNRLQAMGLITFREGVAKSKPAEYTLTGVPESRKIQSARSDVAKTKSEPFSKPSVKEVEDYCLRRRNGIDAHAFCNFYQSKDWMIGRNKMKDWRAAVRTWEKKKDRDKPELVKHDNEKQYEKF